MEFLVVFFALLLFAVVVGGPVFGAEDRPGFKRPERKVRQPVGTWFRPEA